MTAPSTGTEVAPGAHRLGDAVVNFYLLEVDRDHDGTGGLVLVDAGLPGHYAQLTAAVAGLGRALSDIRAVLITHGHPDHTGLAERLRRETGAQVWVAGADAPILAAGPRRALRLAKPERSMLGYLLRRPASIGTPVHMARLGGFTAKPVSSTRAFTPGQTLTEVAGAPTAVAVPGHTAGSVAFHFAQRRLLFTGDALVTHDPMTGVTGPTTVCRAFTCDGAQALASLKNLTGLAVDVVLPGHGDPIVGGLPRALDQARAAGIR